MLVDSILMMEGKMYWKCLLRSWWLTLPVFAVLCYFAIQDKLPEIEADLQGRAAANVGGLDDIAINFHNLGRVGRLTGTVASTELRAQAVGLSESTYGVAGVIDEISVIEALVVGNPEFSELMTVGQVLLDGVVSSLAERDLLVAAAVKRFGLSNIVDNIVVSEAVAPQHWFGGLVDRLDVDNGLTTISVEGDRVTVTGVVASEALREQVLANIRVRVGDSYHVIDDISVQKPEESNTGSADAAVLSQSSRRLLASF
jgi:osmotically-inducible protein OsmY